jgi:hypothetical protein
MSALNRNKSIALDYCRSFGVVFFMSDLDKETMTLSPSFGAAIRTQSGLSDNSTAGAFWRIEL